MNHRVGICIDHTRAVIVSTSTDPVTVNTLDSASRWNAQHLERYYDEIITQLGYPTALLIFGPGEAKMEFKERLSRFTVLAQRIVGLENTDTLTDPQIVAKVKQHYGIDH